MHNRIVIVVNIPAQFTYKVIKILCLSVLKDNNTVVHKICKYKYFNPSYILWAYSIFHQNNENNNKNEYLNRPFLQKSIVFFTVCYDVGSPPWEGTWGAEKRTASHKSFCCVKMAEKKKQQKKPKKQVYSPRLSALIMYLNSLFMLMNLEKLFWRVRVLNRHFVS